MNSFFHVYNQLCMCALFTFMNTFKIEGSKLNIPEGFKLNIPSLKMSSNCSILMVLMAIKNQDLKIRSQLKTFRSIRLQLQSTEIKHSSDNIEFLTNLKSIPHLNLIFSKEMRFNLVLKLVAINFVKSRLKSIKTKFNT